MAASYKKLFKLLIDCEMNSEEFAAKAGISPATFAKMKKDGATISSDEIMEIPVIKRIAEQKKRCIIKKQRQRNSTIA